MTEIQIFIQSTYKSPIIVEFLFTKPNGLHLYVDFELSQSSLHCFQIEYVLVLAFGSPDDSID